MIQKIAHNYVSPFHLYMLSILHSIANTADEISAKEENLKPSKATEQAIRIFKLDSDRKEEFWRLTL